METKLFASVNTITSNYQKMLLGSMAFNFIITILVVILALASKDKDVIYVSENRIENHISEKMQVKLQTSWLIKDIFEVDANSIEEKHRHASKLGEIANIKKRLQDLQFVENVKYQKLAFVVKIDSLTIANNQFPYMVEGRFQRHQYSSQLNNKKANFTFSCKVNKTSLSENNPLGLWISNFTIQQTD
jgi:hypothetical protein